MLQKPPAAIKKLENSARIMLWQGTQPVQAPADGLASLLEMVVHVASYCDANEDVSAWDGVQRALDDGEGKIVYFAPRRYKSLTRSDGRLTMPKRGLVIFAPGAILDTTAWATSGTTHPILYVEGDTPTAIDLSGNPSGSASIESNVIQLDDNSSVTPGQYCIVVSDAFFTTEDGSVGTKGEWVRAAALVENLLLQSETLDDASWTKTRSTVTEDDATSPLGSTTADKLVSDATAASTHYAEQSVSFTTGTTYTFSVYAKASEKTWLRLALPNTAFGSEGYASFNLDTGEVGTTSALTTSDIESVGDDWYRCSITDIATATAAGNARIYIGDADNDITFDGDGTSGIYVWGAQIEAASTLGHYVQTTTAAITNGVLIYGNLRDTYAEADNARLYPMTDLCELTVFNPQIEGCGAFDDGVTGDRGLQIINGKDCHIIGGSIQGSDQITAILTNVYGGSIDGLHTRHDPRATGTIVAYGPHLANLCENVHVKNCDVTGGSEGLGLTATGGIQGPTRDCSFINNHVRGTKRSGVNTHDAHQGILIEGNIIEDCEQGIETRVIDTVIRGNIIRRMGRNTGNLNAGISLGDGSGKIVIQGNTIEDCLRGVWMDDAIPHEFTPGDIDIEGNAFRNIGSAGVSIEYTTGETDALGTVTVRDNTFDGDGTTALRGVEIEGKWKPVVLNNTFRNGNGGRAIFLHATDNGAGTDGPVDPVMGGNVWDSTFTDPLIQHDSGARTEFDNHEIGTPSARLSQVAASGAATAAHTGNTTETELASFTLLANMMGPNGWAEIDVTFGTPGGSANGKTGRVRLNGSTGTVFYASTVTTALSLRANVIIQNRNDTAVQAGGAATALAAGYGSSTSAIPTGAIATTANRTVSITGQLANAADSIRVERYSVKVFYAP